MKHAGRFEIVELPDGALLPAELMNRLGEGMKRYRFSRETAASVGAPWLLVSATGHSTLSVDGAGCVSANGSIAWADPYDEEPDPDCWE